MLVTQYMTFGINIISCYVYKIAEDYCNNPLTLAYVNTLYRNIHKEIFCI